MQNKKLKKPSDIPTYSTIYVVIYSILLNITFLLETRQTIVIYTCSSYIKQFLKILALCSKPFQFKSVSLFSPQQTEKSKKIIWISIPDLHVSDSGEYFLFSWLCHYNNKKLRDYSLVDLLKRL